MADITASVNSWSTTEASNAPSGSTSVSTNLDDNLRAIQSGVRKEFAQSSDITAASNLGLQNATGSYVEITAGGTTTITALSDSSVAAGIRKYLRFKSIGTATTLTHNATSLILPSAANISVAANDTLEAVSLGSGNWAVLNYTKAGFTQVQYLAYPMVIGVVGVAIPAAASFYPNGSSPYRLVSKVDLSRYSQVKLGVNIGGTALSASAKLILKYYTSYSTTAGDWLDIGTSEVSITGTGTNVWYESAWTTLATNAKADVYIALHSSGGDGSTVSIVQAVSAYFKSA